MHSLACEDHRIRAADLRREIRILEDELNIGKGRRKQGFLLNCIDALSRELEAKARYSPPCEFCHHELNNNP